MRSESARVRENREMWVSVEQPIAEEKPGLPQTACVCFDPSS